MKPNKTAFLPWKSMEGEILIETSSTAKISRDDAQSPKPENIPFHEEVCSLPALLVWQAGHRASLPGVELDLEGAKPWTMNHWRRPAQGQVTLAPTRFKGTIPEERWMGTCLTALSLVGTAAHFPTTGRHTHTLPVKAPDLAKILKSTGLHGCLRQTHFWGLGSVPSLINPLRMLVG